MSNAPQLIVDLGSSKIAALLCDPALSWPEAILAFASVPAQGIQRGEVVNVTALDEAIQQLLQQLVQDQAHKPRQAYVTLSSPNVHACNSYGVVRVLQGEVSGHDLERVKDVLMAIPLQSDEKIVHVFEQSYALDYVVSQQTPLGMRGTRLEMNAHVVALPTDSVQHISSVLANHRMHLQGLCYQPVASSYAHFDDEAKEVGVCLLDIGYSNTDLVVYANQQICYSATIPIGVEQCILAVSRAFQLPKDRARQLVIQHGQLCLSQEPALEGVIELHSDRVSSVVTRSELVSMIELTYSVIGDQVANHIRACQEEGFQLSGGLHLTGGGALLKGAAAYLSERCGWPSLSVSSLDLPMEGLNRPSYSALVGLAKQVVDQPVVVAESQSLIKRMKNWWQLHF